MLDYSLPNSSGGEAKVIKQARWIKERAPDKAVLFYTCSMGWNLAPSEGNYDLYTKLPDDLWLKGSDGEHCAVKHGNHTWRIFDLSQDEMVRRWLDSMVRKPLASGVISGIFVDSANLKVGTGQWMSCNGKIPKAKSDKWNAAHAAMIVKAQQIFGDTGIVLSNNFDFPQPDGSLGNHGRFFEQFVGGFDGYNVRRDIAALQKEAAVGRYTEAHGGGPTLFGGQRATTPAQIEQCWAQQLAAFLLGAGERSYFYASLGWSNIAGAGGPPISKEWSWTAWHPDLGRALGPPHSLASVKAIGKGFLYERRFGAGTNVSFWCANAGCNAAATAIGCISWSDGHVTGTCPPHGLHSSTSAGE